jgi:energy-coupling factor transport system ATP-binding protein
VAAQGTPRAFFSGNSFYTTAANRMARGLIPEAVTAEDVIFACGGTASPPPTKKPTQEEPPAAESLPPESALPVEKRRKPGARAVAASAALLLLVPLTIAWGAVVLENRKYYFVSLLVLLECMLPFFLLFEGRKPKARELVVIAVLCALGVAGRAVFFMLPQFKPVMALTIVAGVSFGGEIGFLVGAMTMLTSNMLFGQGPWTPWQMFAMGLVGFLAGVVFHSGLLRPKRGALAVFGAVCAVVVYGGLMNFASAILWGGGLNLGILLSFYATGFPMDCVQAAATAVFLWLGAEPMLEKLERLRVKYGLIG